MFRERERGPSKSLIDNGYFFDKRSSRNPYSSQSFIDHSRLYNVKRSSRHYPAIAQFFDTMDSIKNRYERDYYNPLNNHGDGMYDEFGESYGPNYISKKEYIRKRRSISPRVTEENNNLKEENDKKNLTESKLNEIHPAVRDNLKNKPVIQPSKSVDRQKRANNPVTKDEQNRLRKEAQKDFLTREYFKTIARAVGNKKKRMAYARFKPPLPIDKRSDLSSFLDNPQAIEYLRHQLLGNIFIYNQ